LWGVAGRVEIEACGSRTTPVLGWIQVIFGMADNVRDSSESLLRDNMFVLDVD
jgi:hypothetical protein